MKVIGITGGIATGKSLVTNILLKEGYKVIDTDKIGHQLLFEPDIIEKITNVFGEDIITNNQVDRHTLGRIIFNDKQKQQQLNAIIHPRVIMIVEEKLKTYQYQDIVFVDVPLLYEAGMEVMMDIVIVIYTNQQTQLSRLMKRDNIDSDYALKKITSQMSIEQKKYLADYVINNQGNIEATESQVNILLRRIKNEI